SESGARPSSGWLLRVNGYGASGGGVGAAEGLAERRNGGLIVIERNQGPRNFVETGPRLDARATAELMVTLFSPGSPLHDGALVLRGDQIVAAGCILPLSQNPRLSPVLGTRHRAAVGITDESEAVAAVRCAPP